MTPFPSNTMRPPVKLFCFLLFLSEGFTASCSKPRRSVFFQDMDLKLFKESNFDSLSSLMLRDDVGQLVLGARGKVLTLSLEDITKKTGEVQWTASSADKALCQMKGKNAEECANFIRVLHTMKDGGMLACGTNAFNPVCDHMTFTDGKISMNGTLQSGRGKVPYDPYQRFASLMNENILYSASSSNFLGTDVAFQRHGPNPVKTETKRSWINEPTIISISLVEASLNSANGEDDHVFFFFTENAVEERRGNLQVSRIACVCKSDLGGRRTLQKKWTSFLKARLDCPFGDAGSPSLVQDVFLFPNQSNWRDSVFYATFTSNSDSSGARHLSAVCAYKLEDISLVFSGRFLTETSTGNWEKYTGAEPFPHPAACINDEMRAKGVMSSLDLSDTTLLFAKNHPLMEGLVTPVNGKPLLVQTSTRFTKVAADQVTSLDGKQHHILLIGTESGWLQKAVRFDGEDGRVIEEMQLFPDPRPVDFLQLVPRTGQVYGGARDAAVQVDLRDCSRYTSCDDCLLARDPYCGWDQTRRQCASAAGASTSAMIQNLSDGDPSMCPISDWKTSSEPIHFTRDVAQFLPCSADTNLPIRWRFSGNVLHPGPRHTLLSQGLILTPSSEDSGFYTCETVETVKGRVHRRTVIRYFVQVQDTKTTIKYLKLAVITLGTFSSLLMVLMCTLTVTRQPGARSCVSSSERNYDRVGPILHPPG